MSFAPRCRASAPCKEPLTYLILIGDGLHNFIGGLAIAGTFLIDIRLGLTAWLAAAAHEIPQELGDFAVLIIDIFALVASGLESRDAVAWSLPPSRDG